jgi:hypothetical protein
MSAAKKKPRLQWAQKRAAVAILDEHAGHGLATALRAAGIILPCGKAPDRGRVLVWKKELARAEKNFAAIAARAREEGVELDAGLAYVDLPEPDTCDCGRPSEMRQKRSGAQYLACPRCRALAARAHDDFVADSGTHAAAVFDDAAPLAPPRGYIRRMNAALDAWLAAEPWNRRAAAAAASGLN